MADIVRGAPDTAAGSAGDGLRPPCADFAERVRASFARQAFMAFLGAELSDVRPGFCEIHLPFRPELTQQHGFFHGGVIGTLADDTGGYAAYTLAPPDASVLTVEYKLNLVAPGDGERLVARGRVVRPGRTLVVTAMEVFAVKAGAPRLCATALGTMMLLAGRTDAAPAPGGGPERPAERA